jgi:hypothetical protein
MKQAISRSIKLTPETFLEVSIFVQSFQEYYINLTSSIRATLKHTTQRTYLATARSVQLHWAPILSPGLPVPMRVTADHILMRPGNSSVPGNIVLFHDATTWFPKVSCSMVVFPSSYLWLERTDRFSHDSGRCYPMHEIYRLCFHYTKQDVKFW